MSTRVPPIAELLTKIKNLERKLRSTQRTVDQLMSDPNRPLNQLRINSALIIELRGKIAYYNRQLDSYRRTDLFNNNRHD